MTTQLTEIGWVDRGNVADVLIDGSQANQLTGGKGINATDVDNFDLISSTMSGPGSNTSVVTYFSGSGKVLPSVPAYNWYHGCGPTAAACVIGYWDLLGYSNLFDASDNDVFLTENVKDHISSPEHNAKYDPTPDNPNLPVPTFTSIADWFQTSVDPLNYGWSYLSYADDAFTGYTADRGYNFEAINQSYSSQLWDDLVSEIDSGRPAMFLVDIDGDSSTDHFVPVLGYDDRGSEGRFYGLYTTWSEDESVVWEPFQGLGLGNSWGVGYATFLRPKPMAIVIDLSTLTFTNQADIVPASGTAEIINTGTANTLGGNDRITGDSTSSNPGIENGDLIDTGAGNDTITATGRTIGINNSGTINTGAGNDTITVTATGEAGIDNTGSIDTGKGNDTITATGDSRGINNTNGSTIDTGAGNDTITATSNSYGIYNGDPYNENESTISTGAGNDAIIGGTGDTNFLGINNAGIIDTGAGKDIVDALTGGFNGGGTTDLGEGRDLIRGFGEQIVNGGKGFDTAELEIDFDEITLSNALGSSIDIKYDSATMAFTNVEQFVFNNDVTKTLQQLQEQATMTI